MKEKRYKHMIELDRAAKLCRRWINSGQSGGQRKCIEEDKCPCAAAHVTSPSQESVLQLQKNIEAAIAKFPDHPEWAEAILNQDNRRKLLEAFDTHFLNKKGFMCKGSQVDKNNLKGGGKSNGKDSKGG